MDMNAVLPRNDQTRKSILQFCQWVYGDAPDRVKVDLLMLARSMPTPAGGFEPHLEFDAWVHEEQAQPGGPSTWRRAGTKLLGGDAALLALLAQGRDPLLALHGQGKTGEAEILALSPKLDSIYAAMAAGQAAAPPPYTGKGSAGWL
jgi:hypothetical protein